MADLRKKRTSLSESLKRAVGESGLTVFALAHAAGVAQPVLHRFVRGGRDLTLRTAEKLAAYFGLELLPRRRAKPRGTRAVPSEGSAND